MKNLRERIEALDLPICPIRNLIDDRILACERYTTKDGLKSEYCKKCFSYSTSCQVYQDYLANKFLKENGEQND